MTLLDFAAPAQDALTRWVVEPVLILLLGIFIGKVLEQAFLFAIHEFFKDRRGLLVTAYTLTWAIYILTICLALASIGILWPLLWTLGTLIILVVCINLLFNVRDLLTNVLDFRAVHSRIAPGESIKTKYGSGKVIAVRLIDTHLRLGEGEDLYIPNRTMRYLKIETTRASK